VWAEACRRSEAEVLDTLRRWLALGTLRRFGVVVRHHEAGFAHNAMTVFDVPDALADACGERLAQQPGVTLAYRRARDSGWPYNVYCMVHGRDRAAVEAAIAAAAAGAGLDATPRAVLFSRRRFKQCGARYFGEAPAGVADAVETERVTA
jgi:DNA-binding Lrp family transcriptional regulator